MPATVGWKSKVGQSQHATGSSTSRFSPLEAFAEWGYPIPRNAMESSMKTCAFTPSHETGILVAHILPYAGSHDTRMGRERSGPQVPPGIHVFQAADGQGAFLRSDR